MNRSQMTSLLLVRDINLWAHVGVLKKERILGQEFLLDIFLWVNTIDSSFHDNIDLTTDYSHAIIGLQNLAFSTQCQTIEKFSEKILDFLDEIYGPLPVKIVLTKCRPPVDGFCGDVQIIKWRNNGDLSDL